MLGIVLSLLSARMIVYIQLITCLILFLVSDDVSRVDSVVQAFYTGQATTIESSFNSITWTNNTITAYQNALTSNKDHFEYCYGGLVRYFVEYNNAACWLVVQTVGRFCNY